jgi:phage terminase small subunit
MVTETKKPAKRKKKTKVKVGGGKDAQNAKHVAFAHAYIANGQNGTQAAIEAGYSVNGAATAARRMLRIAQVKQIIADSTAKAAEISGLSVERTLKEIARIAYSDPRKLFDENGKLIDIHKLDDDTAATIASVDVDELFEGSGKEREQVGNTKKIKVWDKNAALEKAMKFHGLYEKDNKQKTDGIESILKEIAKDAGTSN